LPALVEELLIFLCSDDVLISYFQGWFGD